MTVFLPFSSVPAIKWHGLNTQDLQRHKMLEQASKAYANYLRCAQMEHRLLDKVLDNMTNKQIFIE